jgi:hypothetical protein
MKNNILTFLLGIFVTISIATTVPNTGLFTVKPATPKATIVVSGWGTPELNNNIKPYLKAGYVVKNLSAGDGARIVVMEKY